MTREFRDANGFLCSEDVEEEAAHPTPKLTPPCARVAVFMKSSWLNAVSSFANVRALIFALCFRWILKKQLLRHRPNNNNQSPKQQQLKSQLLKSVSSRCLPGAAWLLTHAFAAKTSREKGEGGPQSRSDFCSSKGHHELFRQKVGGLSINTCSQVVHHRARTLVKGCCRHRVMSAVCMRLHESWPRSRHVAVECTHHAAITECTHHAAITECTHHAAITECTHHAAITDHEEMLVDRLFGWFS